MKKKVLSPTLLFASMLVVFAATCTFAAPAKIEWTFDNDLNGREEKKALVPTLAPPSLALFEGVSGKALNVTSKAPVTYSIPAAFVRECALSFYYKLPRHNADSKRKGAEKVVILRMGDYALTYEANKRLFFHTGEAERPNGVALHRDQLREDEYVLIELGWSREQPCFIFIRGIASTWMRNLVSPKVNGESVDLTLVAGTFDEMRLGPNVETSGARYRGVLAKLDFESEKFDSYFLFRNRHHWKDKLHRVRGYNGSQGALKTDEAEGRHISVSLYIGYVRVTEEMYLCGAFRSSNGNATRLFVRTYPRKLEHHPNYWLRFSTPKDRWFVDKTPLSRWGLKPGYLVDGVIFGSGGKGRRFLSADNVTLVRGRDTVRPDKVTSVRARETDAGGVELNWHPARDNVCTSGYVVYWSNVPKMTLEDEEVVGRTHATSFTHDRIPHAGTYYYTVAAVDVFGNIGPAADAVKVEVKE